MFKEEFNKYRNLSEEELKDNEDIEKTKVFYYDKFNNLKLTSCSEVLKKYNDNFLELEAMKAYIKKIEDNENFFPRFRLSVADNDLRNVLFYEDLKESKEKELLINIMKNDIGDCRFIKKFLFNLVAAATYHNTFFNDCHDVDFDLLYLNYSDLVQLNPEAKYHAYKYYNQNTDKQEAIIFNTEGELFLCERTNLNGQSYRGNYPFIWKDIIEMTDLNKGFGIARNRKIESEPKKKEPDFPFEDDDFITF
jgi:hypothetical protein